MRIISTSEYELGFIAVGPRPMGVIALGAFPIGVIAIGIVPVGLVSLASGASVGLLNLTCGVGIGAFVRGCGVAIGADAKAVGLALSMTKKRAEPPPVPVKRATISAERALQQRGLSWIEMSLDDAGHVVGLDVAVDLKAVPKQARRRSGQTVHARVEAVVPEAPPTDGYRAAAKPIEPYLRCSRLEPATPPRPLAGRLWYPIALAIAAAVVLGIIGAMANSRLALTKMTRVIDARWNARVKKSEGVFIAEDAKCHVAARLRSDGAEQLHAKIKVRCGSLSLFKVRVREGCSVKQAPAAGGYVYQLRCTIKRRPARRSSDSNRPERPGLDLNTSDLKNRVRIFANGPPPMNTVLDVNSSSEPVAGPALLLPAEAR